MILVTAIIVCLVLVPASFFVRVQSLQIQKLLILVSDVSLLGHVAVILLDHVWHEGLKEQFFEFAETKIIFKSSLFYRTIFLFSCFQFL